MSAIARTALTIAYIGAEQPIPSGAKSIEVWGVDADPATAHAAIWFRLSSQGATPDVEILIAAGQTYQTEIKPGNEWTYNAKAVAGTPDAMVVIV